MAHQSHQLLRQRSPQKIASLQVQECSVLSPILGTVPSALLLSPCMEKLDLHSFIFLLIIVCLRLCGQLRGNDASILQIFLQLCLLFLRRVLLDYLPSWHNKDYFFRCRLSKWYFPRT